MNVRYSKKIIELFIFPRKNIEASEDFLFLETELPGLAYIKDIIFGRRKRLLKELLLKEAGCNVSM